MTVRTSRRRLTVGLFLGVGSQLPAQKQIPIRTLGPVETASIERLGYVSGVRELSDGSVLVNDAGKRRLLAFDRTLGSLRVLADTTP